MKIVHVVISEKFIEGMSYQENLLSHKHKELGHDVYIIAAQMYFDRNGKKVIAAKEYVNSDGIKVIILPCSTTFHHLHLFIKKVKGLYIKLIEISPDIIFVHGLTAKDNYTIVNYVRKNRNVKVFADNHNDFYNSPITSSSAKLRLFFQKKYAQSLIPYTQRFWGTIPWRNDYMNEVYGIPKEKIDLLVMGANEKLILGKNREQYRSIIRKKYNIPLDSFLIVTGGVLDKRKRQDLLLESVKCITDKNIYLLVFGSPTKEMESVCEKYKDVKNIRLIGWLNSNDVYDIFLASDLAFFPGTHSVLWEQSIACALPAVFNFFSGMQHVNVNGNALLLKEMTVDTITSTIIELYYTEKYYLMLERAKTVASSFFLKDVALKSIQ